MFAKFMDTIGNVNPQLFREWKSRLTPRNLLVITGISALTQVLVYCYFQQKLAKIASHYSSQRYCEVLNLNEFRSYLSSSYLSPQCHLNESGKFIINHELWFLDIFVTLSFMSVFVLLVGGTYLLIQNITQEKQKKTLNFILLSPQSKSGILWGKLLGVPSLIYWAVLMVLPFQVFTGLSAKIPFHLILGFDGMILLSSIFFFTVALFFGLVIRSLGGIKAGLGSLGIVFFFWWIIPSELYSYKEIFFNPVDWFTLFSPTKMLHYLVATTPHSLDTIDYYNIKDFALLKWYDLPLWSNAVSGCAFMVANYLVVTFCFWQGLTRYLENPKQPLLSRQQSYWLSGTFMLILVGFAVQREWEFHPDDLSTNFSIVLLFQLFFCLGLIAALTPQRDILQAWARYRHHQHHKRQLLGDLVWGEKSPATLAVALNLIPSSSVLLVAFFLCPLEEHRLSLIATLMVLNGIIVVYASVVQWFLLQKTLRREVWALAAIGSHLALPTIILSIFYTDSLSSNFALATASPILTIMASQTYAASLAGAMLCVEGLATVLLNLQFTRQLNQLGASQTQLLTVDS